MLVFFGLRVMPSSFSAAGSVLTSSAEVSACNCASRSASCCCMASAVSPARAMS